MNECWKFFRYPEISDTDKIINIFKYDKWLSKYKHTYIQNKIKKNECIYESGVIINFTLVRKKINIGNININPNNTLTSSLIISEYAGKDTLFINLYDDNDQPVYNYAINNNYSKIDNYSLKIPHKIIFRGNNFSGTIDYSFIVQ